MSKGFCSSADPTGFLGHRIYSGRNLLRFQLKLVVVWFFPPFCVQLHSSEWCHCFSMYMYLQPQYCVSYSLNINNFYNFKTGGVLDYLLILCFPSAEILGKTKKKQVCMTYDSISGPRQRRSLQKLEMVIATVLVHWYCLVSCCARVNSVGGFWKL